MRLILRCLWFIILISVALGYMEVGLTWVYCHSIIREPDLFWAFLGIPVSLNICLGMALGAKWK